jgi:hypothetical protein
MKTPPASSRSKKKTPRSSRSTAGSTKRRPAAKRQKKKKQKPAEKPRRTGADLVFPEVAGKVVEAVELWMNDYPCVIIAFEDKTNLVVDVESYLTMEAEYMDSSSGEDRSIKKWPQIYN